MGVTERLKPGQVNLIRYKKSIQRGWGEGGGGLLDPEPVMTLRRITV